MEPAAFDATLRLMSAPAREAVYDALSELPRPAQECLHRLYFLGETAEAAARAPGLPPTPDGVRRLEEEALLRLAAVLDEEAPAPAPGAWEAPLVRTLLRLVGQAWRSASAPERAAAAAASGRVLTWARGLGTPGAFARAASGGGPPPRLSIDEGGVLASFTVTGPSTGRVTVETRRPELTGARVPYRVLDEANRPLVEGDLVLEPRRDGRASGSATMGLPGTPGGFEVGLPAPGDA